LLHETGLQVQISLPNKRPRGVNGYPCEWQYQIIGPNEQQIRAAVAEIVTAPFTLTATQTSKTGKYHSLRLLTTVASEEVRTSIYAALSQHPSVKVVM
jgi:putative lipoic acid-binding regulatory protein